jgi:hypothetical protein
LPRRGAETAVEVREADKKVLRFIIYMIIFNNISFQR